MMKIRMDSKKNHKVLCLPSAHKVLCLLALSCVMAHASEAAGVRVAGIALNATRIVPAAGVSIELIRPDNEGKSGTRLAQTKTDARGRFDFGTMQLAKDDLLLARAQWQGFGYISAAYDGEARLKQFGVSATPGNIQVKVYDTTNKPPQIKFTVHHLAIESSEKGLKCIERIVVDNPGRATFTGIGPSQGTIVLDLPKAARDVKLAAKIPGKIFKTTHGYTVSTPITPSQYNKGNPLAGQNAVIVEYFVDWPSQLPWAKRVDLSQHVHYPTNFFFVARTEADKSLRVTSPQLGKDLSEQLPIEGAMETRLINAVGRPMGNQPALLPESTLQVKVEREVNPLFWVFLAFLVVMSVGVPLALRGGKKRRGASKDKAAKRVSTSAEPHQATLVDHRTLSANGETRASSKSAATSSADVSHLAEQIAELDEAHESGGIETAEYQVQRAELKRQLMAQIAKN